MISQKCYVEFVQVGHGKRLKKIEQLFFSEIYRRTLFYFSL